MRFGSDDGIVEGVGALFDKLVRGAARALPRLQARAAKSPSRCSRFWAKIEFTLAFIRCAIEGAAGLAVTDELYVSGCRPSWWTTPTL